MITLNNRFEYDRDQCYTKLENLTPNPVHVFGYRKTAKGYETFVYDRREEIEYEGATFNSEARAQLSTIENSEQF